MIPRSLAGGLAALLATTVLISGAAFAQAEGEPTEDPSARSAPVASAEPNSEPATAEPEPEAEPEPTTEAPEPDPTSETPEPSSTPTQTPTTGATAAGSTTPSSAEPTAKASRPAENQVPQPATDPTSTPTTTPASMVSAPGKTAVAQNVGQTEPSWPHYTLSHSSGAVVWISSEASAGDQSIIRLRGTGWLTTGQAASTIAVKLNRGPNTQYTRSGSDIITHPSAAGDDTIWALLAAANPTGHPNVSPVAADGSFDIEISAPSGLTVGQYFSVTLQSGRFDSTDVQRSLTSDYLSVGGTAWTDDDDGTQITCTPSTTNPQVSVAASATLGGTLRVSGTGWCHPTDGGSVIAIKLDEGGYSHIDASVHQNRTIWTLVEADATTGDWSIDLQLPDGTTATSLPAFPEGSHSLRLLTGSMKSGDVVRTMLSASFTVGTYQPLNLPEPLDPETELLPTTTGGITVDQQADQLRVTLPASTPRRLGSPEPLRRPGAYILVAGLVPGRRRPHRHRLTERYHPAQWQPPPYRAIRQC